MASRFFAVLGFDLQHAFDGFADVGVNFIQGFTLRSAAWQLQSLDPEATFICFVNKDCEGHR